MLCVQEQRGIVHRDAHLGDLPFLYISDDLFSSLQLLGVGWYHSEDLAPHSQPSTEDMLARLQAFSSMHTAT